MVLDKNKPFGEIWGGDGKARFEQDGVYFDANGDALPGQEEEAPRNRGGRPRKAAEPEQPTLDAELEAQINANLEG